MENDLTVINQFLTDFPFEVLARSGEEFDDDFRERLDQLAAGNFPEDSRDRLASDVLANPAALEYLATLARKRQGDLSEE